MELGTVGTLVAIVVSVGSLAVAVMSYRQRADSEVDARETRLEARIAALEKHVEDCDRDRERLSNENIALMRKILESDRKRT